SRILVVDDREEGQDEGPHRVVIDPFRWQIAQLGRPRNVILNPQSAGKSEDVRMSVDQALQEQRAAAAVCLHSYYAKVGRRDGERVSLGIDIQCGRQHDDNYVNILLILLSTDP